MPDEVGKEQANGDGDERWPDPSQSVEELKTTAKRLKVRIEQEKRRMDLPVDSTLGDPNWDKRAKDGNLDLPDDQD